LAPIFASKVLFAVSADSFSPQGVQSVGLRLFEILILQVFREHRSRLLGHPFSSAGWPSEVKNFKTQSRGASGTQRRRKPTCRVVPNGAWQPSRPVGSFFQDGLAGPALGSYRKTQGRPRNLVTFAPNERFHADWVRFFKTASPARHWARIVKFKVDLETR